MGVGIHLRHKLSITQSSMLTNTLISAPILNTSKYFLKPLRIMKNWWLKRIRIKQTAQLGEVELMHPDRMWLPGRITLFTPRRFSQVRRAYLEGADWEPAYCGSTVWDERGEAASMWSIKGIQSWWRDKEQQSHARTSQLDAERSERSSLCR